MRVVHVEERRRIERLGDRLHAIVDRAGSVQITTLDRLEHCDLQIGE